MMSTENKEEKLTPIQQERFDKLNEIYFEKHDKNKLSLQEKVILACEFYKAATTNILPPWLALEITMPSISNHKFLHDIETPVKIVFYLPGRYR